MKRLLGCLSMAALAIVLAAPVSAQTVTVRVSVPFDFLVGGRTMPAGDYIVATSGNTGMVLVQNLTRGIVPVMAPSNATDGPRDTGKAFLAFRRYGSDYFLAKIWDGSADAGRSLPTSTIEREKAKTASIRKPEVVMVLARR